MSIAIRTKRLIPSPISERAFEVATKPRYRSQIQEAPDAGYQRATEAPDAGEGRASRMETTYSHGRSRS